MKKLAKYSAVIYPIFLFFLFADIVFPQGKTEKLDQYLNNFKNNKDVPSISAGVAHAGKIVWLGANGYSDIENNVHASSNTVYRIASISKTITAVAIMQLVEKGKVKLDDDALKYLPFFPKKKWKFTVRQLLNHTSGIRTYKPGEFNSTRYFPTIKDAISVLINDPLAYKPGTKYLYTTLGYNLLAAIIENVSGLTFPQYLQTYIFGPSCMYSTETEYQPALVPHRARGYVRDKKRNLINAPLADLSIKYPGGGIISTSDDLLNFGIHLMDGTLLKPSTIDSMLVPVKLTNGRIIPVGLGLEIKKDKDGNTYYGHLGGGTGFSCLLLMYPKDSLVTVDLININDYAVKQPADNLAKIFFGDDVPEPKILTADRLAHITINYGLDSTLSALSSFETDHQHTYDLSPNELARLGNIFVSLNRTNDALTYLKYLVNNNPASVILLNSLAGVYEKNLNFTDALAAYKKAQKLEPGNSKIIEKIKFLEKRR